MNNQTKIPIKIIQEIIKEQIPVVREIIKQPGTNTWWFRFANAEDMTDDVYETLKKLSFIPSRLTKEFNREHKNIMAELNLKEVNTYYERQIKTWGNQKRNE